MVHHLSQSHMDPLSLIAAQSHIRWECSPSQEDDRPEDPPTLFMDSEIWHKLGPELLERVLAFVPVPSLMRLRTVCKDWKSVISSTAFTASQSHHFKSRHPCYLTNVVPMRDRIISVFYNPVLKMWHEHLVPDLIWQHCFTGDSLPPRLVASDGGLLLLGGGATPMHSVYAYYLVCHPMTGEFRTVPPHPSLHVHAFVRIVTEPCTKNFKVVMALNMHEPHDLTVKIFDSKCNDWVASSSSSSATTVNSSPSMLHLLKSVDPRQCGVICKGALHLIAGHQYGVIVALDLRTGVWSEVTNIPDAILKPHLVERHGELAVVGGLDNMFTLARWPNPQSIGIWRVNPPGREVVRLPKLLCRELQKWINLAEFRCAFLLAVYKFA